MSQYKRMVSYLYKYINGAKSQNTGFVRIELMDKQCRFTVQMRMIPFEVYPKVYLYIQKERGAKCIEVSDMGVKSGNLVSRFMLNRENIEQTGYSFDDIDGLIVYIGKEMFFATSWVKDEVKLGEMEIFSPTGKKENIFKTDKSREDAFNSEKIEKDSNKENGTVSLSGETAENNNVEVHNSNVANINDSAGSVNGAFETEKIKSDNNAKEYYLPDALKLLLDKNEVVSAFVSRKVLSQWILCRMFLKRSLMKNLTPKKLLSRQACMMRGKKILEREYLVRFR